MGTAARPTMDQILQQFYGQSGAQPQQQQMGTPAAAPAGNTNPLLASTPAPTAGGPVGNWQGSQLADPSNPSGNIGGYGGFDPSNPLTQSQTFQKLIQQGVSGVGAGQDRDALMGFANQFASTYKNLTGKDPGTQDYEMFFSNIVAPQLVGGGKGVLGNNYADVQNVLNPYLQNTYQKDITSFGQQQQDQARQTAMGQAQTLVDQMNQNSLSALTSPDSMQRYGQGMNQLGLLNSGAYSTGLADKMAQAASGNQSAALQEVGLPGINNQMNSATAPFASFLQNLNPNLQGFGASQTGARDFQQQAQLAEMLQKMMQPSQLQQWAPIISGAMQGGGAAFAGAAPFILG